MTTFSSVSTRCRCRASPTRRRPRRRLCSACSLSALRAGPACLLDKAYHAEHSNCATAMVIALRHPHALSLVILIDIVSTWKCTKLRNPRVLMQGTRVGVCGSSARVASCGLPCLGHVLLAAKLVAPWRWIHAWSRSWSGTQGFRDQGEVGALCAFGEAAALYLCLEACWPANATARLGLSAATPRVLHVVRGFIQASSFKNQAAMPQCQ